MPLSWESWAGNQGMIMIQLLPLFSLRTASNDADTGSGENAQKEAKVEGSSHFDAFCRLHVSLPVIILLTLHKSIPFFSETHRNWTPVNLKTVADHGVPVQHFVTTSTWIKCELKLLYQVVEPLLHIMIPVDINGCRASWLRKSCLHMWGTEGH